MGAESNAQLYTQCVNGVTGCNPGAVSGSHSICLGTQDLAGTGFDTSAPGKCNSNSLLGGGSGWLNFAGNVVPGEVATLRIAIWDTGDDADDSTVLLDHFEWLPSSVMPGAGY